MQQEEASGSEWPSSSSSPSPQPLPSPFTYTLHPHPHLSPRRSPFTLTPTLTLTLHPHPHPSPSPSLVPQAREKEWRQSRYRQLAQQQEWSSLHDLHVPDPPAWSRPDHPSHLGSGSRSGTGVERSVRSEVTSPVHKWRDWPTTGTDTDTAVPPGVRGAGPGSAACSSTKRGGGSPTSTKLTSPQLNPPSGSFCCCHGTPSHGTQPSHLTPSAKGHGSSSSSGGGCGGGLVPPTHRQAPPSTTSSNPIGASAAARGMAYRKGGRVAWQGEEQRVQHVLNLARQAEAGKLLTKGQTQQMINMARDFRAT